MLDCGNSGTSIRLLTGLLAGRPFLSVLTGDESLVERPMARVIEPLGAMGAHLDGRDGGTKPPIVVRGGDLAGCVHHLAVASAQVKTALVLAGLQAAGTTEVVEPAASRDHTERMLAALGAPITRVGDRAMRVTAGAPSPFEFTVPGDPSSAAFFVVAAAITPGSELVIEGVALNPTRIGFVDVLLRMGADIEIVDTGEHLGEPVGELRVTSAPLHGTIVEGAEIPGVIDEIPVLAVAAAFAEGVTEFRDAAELRVKESDRIATVTEMLTRLGVGVESGADGLVVRGGRLQPGEIDSHGDHRIAMAGAVAASCDRGRDPGAGLALGRHVVSRVHGRPRVAHGSRVVRLVAIDGPAGSGKSTVARGVAAALGLPTLDTGAMYRAIALAALDAGVELDDADAVAARGADRRHHGRAGRHHARRPRRVRRDPRSAGDRRGVDGVGAPTGPRGARRPSAGLGRAARWGSGRRPRHRHGRVARRAPQGVPHRERRRARGRRQRDEVAAQRTVEANAVRDALNQRDRADGTLGRATRPEDAAPDAVVIDTSDITADVVIADLVARAERAFRVGA